jgi:hypothetical protein
LDCHECFLIVLGDSGDIIPVNAVRGVLPADAGAQEVPAPPGERGAACKVTLGVLEDTLSTGIFKHFRHE